MDNPWNDPTKLVWLFDIFFKTPPFKSEFVLHDVSWSCWVEATSSSLPAASGEATFGEATFGEAAICWPDCRVSKSFAWTAWAEGLLHISYIVLEYRASNLSFSCFSSSLKGNFEPARSSRGLAMSSNPSAKVAELETKLFLCSAMLGPRSLKKTMDLQTTRAFKTVKKTEKPFRGFTYLFREFTYFFRWFTYLFFHDFFEKWKNFGIPPGLID